MIALGMYMVVAVLTAIVNPVLLLAGLGGRIAFIVVLLSALKAALVQRAAARSDMSVAEAGGAP